MEVKKLGFGLMCLLIKDENDVIIIDMEYLNKMVDIFLERGFIYFDIVYVYYMGKSEIVFREFLVKRYKRESFIIVIKFLLMVLKKKEE